jgi:hypothetical protein
MLYSSPVLSSPAGQKYLKAVTEVEAVSNIILFLVNPGQHSIQMQAKEACIQDCMHQQEESSHLKKILLLLRQWQSIFAGQSLIINRATPDHLDRKGCLFGMDLLQALGFGKEVFLNLPNLGARLKIRPNSAVLLAGKFLRHSVQEWRGRDRICVARWIREAILDKFHIQHPELPCYSDVTSYLSPC